MSKEHIIELIDLITSQEDIIAIYVFLLQLLKEE